jgi:phosphatidate cytidylyltransferase
MLRQRVITAAVLLSGAISFLFLVPQWAWALVTGGVMLIGAAEWGRLAGWRASGVIVFGAVVAVSGALLGWSALQHPLGNRLVVIVCAGALAFWLLAALPWLLLRTSVRGAAKMALTGWWVLVPAWLALVWLQGRPWLLLSLLAVVWVSDSAAYLVGRSFGRHKLAPAISPGKTWEGVGAAVVAVLAYLAVLGLVSQPAWPAFLTLEAAGAFLGLTALGIIGDLFESWVKRGAGVKDSGKLLPGHGGVLDRIDALTASLPLAALAAVTVFAG